MPSRRSFLQLAAATLGGAVSPQWLLAAPEAGRRRQLSEKVQLPASEWPEGPANRLGRGALGWGAPILTRPHFEGSLLGHVYPEEVVRIQREVVGRGMAFHSHVWYELDDGYVYKPHLQPVYNLPQTPLTAVPNGGVWVEVSVPYVDGRSQPQIDAPIVYRLYYSAIFQVVAVVPGSDGSPWYQVTMETGITLYVPATTLRPITDEELTPLSPEVDPFEKKIVVYLGAQALSAFEAGREVFRAQISSGANYFGEDGKTLLNGTPQGTHPIWSKRLSRHMQGGTIDAGYDVPGVGWVAYFAANGAALHSTYWHNDFGIPKSHGCLNCRPVDAQWLFRWTTPLVPYDPGNITVTWESRGTAVELVGAD